MSKNKKTIKKQQKDKEYISNKLWKEEVKKRIDFGISKDFFLPAFGKEVRFCDLKYYRDFDSLYFSFVTNRYYDEISRRKTLVDTVKKYKKYTFKQIKDSGGASKLSLLCPFVYIIKEEEIEYQGSKIDFFYREKNASKLKKYPQKVLEIFNSDKYCKSVAYLYKVTITKKVLVEKHKVGADNLYYL